MRAFPAISWQADKETAGWVKDPRLADRINDTGAK
jgi:hypothetical protein